MADSPKRKYSDAEIRRIGDRIDKWFDRHPIYETGALVNELLRFMKPRQEDK